MYIKNTQKKCFCYLWELSFHIPLGPDHVVLGGGGGVPWLAPPTPSCPAADHYGAKKRMVDVRWSDYDTHVEHNNVYCCLTLIRLGGGGPSWPPPPRHISRLLGNARSSRRDTLWQFSFEFPAHFDTKFVTAGGTVPKLRNIVYMHVGPKMAPKCDFCVQNQCKLSFLT